MNSVSGSNNSAHHAEPSESPHPSVAPAIGAQATGAAGQGTGAISRPSASGEESVATFHCLYCDIEKSEDESTLEHAIPQFLGGAQAPLHYKLRNVCRRCNSLLGLHVDASYARSWTVTNGLALAARKLYTGPGGIPLPLACVGPLPDMPGLVVPDGMAAEFWVGPSGENIVWIRSNNEGMYWYMGGNPIDQKKIPSTLYYLPTTADPVGFQMGVEAFLGAFKKANARRIFGAELRGVPAGTLYPGFDAPTEAERANLNAILQANRGESIHARMRVNLTFDQRFICKMVLAVGYSLFGESFLRTEAAREARLGLWPKAEQPSRIRGVGSLGGISASISQLTGYPGAVTVMVLRAGGHYMMTVSVDQQMPFTVELSPATLRSPQFDASEGYALLLFPQLRRSIELPAASLLAHRLGNQAHPELALVDATAAEAEAFNAKLPPLPPRPTSP